MSTNEPRIVVIGASMNNASFVAALEANDSVELVITHRLPQPKKHYLEYANTRNKSDRKRNRSDRWR